MPKPTKKQIEAMQKLGFSEEEIKDIIATDEAIDKGERVYFDLDPEKEKEAKKYIKSWEGRWDSQIPEDSAYMADLRWIYFQTDSKVYNPGRFFRWFI